MKFVPVLTVLTLLTAFNQVDQNIVGYSQWRNSCEDESDCNKDTCRQFFNPLVPESDAAENDALYACWSLGRGRGGRCHAQAAVGGDCEADLEDDVDLGDAKNADGKPYAMWCDKDTSRKTHMCDETRPMIPTIKMPNGRRQAFIGGFLGILLYVCYAYLSIVLLKAVRKRYKMPDESVFCDCICGFCCGCLVACRVMRHVTPRVFQGCSCNGTGSAGKDVWLWKKDSWPEQLLGEGAVGLNVTDSGPAADGATAKKEEFEFGTKFNPNTGDAIPQFDADTGRQNW
jgi:hypothetical protein